MTYGNALAPLEAHLLEKRILVVDDEIELAGMIRDILHAVGFSNVQVAHSGEEALSLVGADTAGGPSAKGGRGSAGHPFDLFILDVMRPGIDGFQLLARLHALPQAAEAPALFLTAKDEPFDRVNGLSLGADDYVVKPFLPQELILRIAVILRRRYANESPLLELAFCTVDFDTACVERKDGTTAELTAKEHEILSVLARNLGRIVTIDALCEACWGTSFGDENSLRAHIRRLREKIEENPSKPRSLTTAKGLGYKLAAAR